MMMCILLLAADGDGKKGASSRSMRVILAQVATLIFSVMIQVLCVEGRGGVLPPLPAPIAHGRIRTCISPGRSRVRCPITLTRACVMKRQRVESNHLEPAYETGCGTIRMNSAVRCTPPPGIEPGAAERQSAMLPLHQGGSMSGSLV